DASVGDAQKEGRFQHFYQVIQQECDQERPSDCTIVSVDKEQREYATVVGNRLQDHGLVVEMIHLASESGLPEALQEVRDDGSPLIVLIDHHMPLEDALVLEAKEYRRFFAKREQQEHTGISLRAGDLVADFLARECLTSYCVPSGVQHLLFLLNEGRHLYKNELNLLIDYLKTRKGQLEGLEMPNPLSRSAHSSFQGKNTPVMGKPPPLLPTPRKRSFPGPPPPGSCQVPFD
ncbi:hypothetical protein EI555_001236, partial [Monodon monoceros]